MSDHQHEHDTQQCRSLFARLSEYLDNELDGETRRFVDEHLRTCQPCRVCLTTLKRTVAFLRSTRPVRLPEGYSQRLRKLLKGLKA